MKGHNKQYQGVAYYSEVPEDFYAQQYTSSARGVLLRVAQQWFRRRQDTTQQLVRRYHRGGAILDVGCGNSVWNHDDLPIIGLDVSRSMLAHNRLHHPAWQPVRADFRQGLPFADGSISLVVITEVLEHFEGYLDVLGEIHRVLVPGGHVIISVPYGRLPGLWALIFPSWCRYKVWRYGSDYYRGQCGHCVHFDFPRLRRDLTGFTVVEERSLLLLTIFLVARRS